MARTIHRGDTEGQNAEAAVNRNVTVIVKVSTKLAHMHHRAVCKATDHLFVPVMEVRIPLLRCIHCDVFAYQETVKELAKNRSYRHRDGAISIEPRVKSLWKRLRNRLFP